MKIIILVCLTLLFATTMGIAQSKHNHHHDQNFHSNNVNYNFDYDDDSIYFPMSEDEENSLVLVNVLFRHGNRTADSAAELYPNDPYLNFDYFPYGLGQLTRAGKLKEYMIGTALRKRYNNFLGEYYYPQIVEAISTDYNRTKMSLQLALAGLFPPRSDDVFVQGLPWQPVPFNYVPRSEDKLLLGNLCPRYIQLYETVTRSAEIQREFQLYKKLFHYISKYSGVNVTAFVDVYQMYFGLSTEQEYGLELPQWTNAVWPERVKHLAIKEYFLSMATTEMKQMLAGYLLKKLILDARTRLASDGEHGRKMHVYSAHENNIAQLLIALGVFQDHVPNYGAYVIIEVHKIDGVPGIKIFYENYTGKGPELLKMPGCDIFCPFDRFVSLVKRYLPTNDAELCGN